MCHGHSLSSLISVFPPHNLSERANMRCFDIAAMQTAEVKRWKPHKDVYLLAASRLGLEPHQLMLVSRHPWDIHGAQQAGYAAII